MKNEQKGKKQDSLELVASDLLKASVDVGQVKIVGHLPYEENKLQDIHARLIVLIGGGGTGRT